MRGRAAVLLLLAMAPAAAATSVVVDPPAVTRGGLAIVRADAVDARGSFEGAPLVFFPAGSGAVALVGIDLDHRPGRFRLRVESPSRGSAAAELEVLPKDVPEERLTVPKTYTELDPKTLQRVERERKLLAALWPKSAARRYWTGDFVKPADGPPGSPFGLRRFFNGEPRSPHAGVDFRAPAGAPVVASNRGRVALARDLFFTGNTVVLDHGLGLFTLYVHLSELGVSSDRMVDRGQELGKVGATGRVTGPHLHFAARLGRARIDPMALLGRALD